MRIRAATLGWAALVGLVYTSVVSTIGGQVTGADTVKAIKSGTLYYDPAAPGRALVGGDHGGDLRGAHAVDIQHSREFDFQVASGSRSVAIGVDVRSVGDSGVVIGDGSLSSSVGGVVIGRDAFGGGDFGNIVIGDGASAGAVASVVIGYGATQAASKSQGVILGQDASGGAAAVSIGVISEAENQSDIAIGLGSLASGSYSVAVGGGSSGSTGARALAPNSTAVGAGSRVNPPATGGVAIGGVLLGAGGAFVSQPGGIAIGGDDGTHLAASVSGINSIGLGTGVVNAIDNTILVNACPIIMDGNTSAAEPLMFTAGSQCIIASEEINALAPTSYRLDLPAGAHFFLDEVDVVVAELAGGAVTAQPTVSIGDRDEADSSGSASRFMAATLMTDLQAELSREVLDAFADANGTTSLSADVTVSGAGPATYRIRYFFKGMLVKDS